MSPMLCAYLYPNAAYPTQWQFVAIAVLPIPISSTGICSDVMLVEYPIRSPDKWLLSFR